MAFTRTASARRTRRRGPRRPRRPARRTRPRPDFEDVRTPVRTLPVPVVGPPAGLRVLRASAALSVVALIIAVVGLLVDRTVITGAPAWAKPAKFGLSVALYCATLAWLLSLVRGHHRLVRVVAATAGLSLVTELLLIDLQVLRGTTSHFNKATVFDAAVFGVMGALVGAIFLAAVVTAVLLLVQRGLAPVLASGIRAGLLVTLLGMAEAILMITNSLNHPGSGHTVGGPDGGPGLPLVGWSTDHGDLRVAHFVGLHALQVLPLLALVLHRHQRAPARAGTRAAGTGPPVAVHLVRVVASCHAAVVVLLTWQAEAGRPLLHPTAPMVGVAGALVVVATAAVVVLLRSPRAHAARGRA